MKFNCDYFKDMGRYNRAKRWDSLCEWHDYFPWFPTRIKHGDCRWLEMVQRRHKYPFNELIRDSFIQENDTFCMFIFREKPETKEKNQ